MKSGKNGDFLPVKQIRKRTLYIRQTRYLEKTKLWPSELWYLRANHIIVQSAIISLQRIGITIFCFTCCLPHCITEDNMNARLHVFVPVLMLFSYLFAFAAHFATDESFEATLIIFVSESKAHLSVHITFLYTPLLQHSGEGINHRYTPGWVLIRHTEVTKTCHEGCEYFFYNVTLNFHSLAKKQTIWSSDL